jgi:quercetin dioxygenase-like cupin family protein
LAVICAAAADGGNFQLFTKSSKAVSTKDAKSAKAYSKGKKEDDSSLFTSCADVQAKLDTCEAAASEPEITWTYPITKINGETPPGKLQPLVNSETMLDTTQSDGNRLVVTKGTRLAGTRVAVHVHQYGGHTCVIEGTITDFVEGEPDGIYPAGTCYYMPANTPMTAANLGTEDALLIDTFVLPFGAPTITILEPGYNK